MSTHFMTTCMLSIVGYLGKDCKDDKTHRDHKVHMVLLHGNYHGHSILHYAIDLNGSSHLISTQEKTSSHPSSMFMRTWFCIGGVLCWQPSNYLSKEKRENIALNILHIAWENHYHTGLSKSWVSTLMKGRATKRLCRRRHSTKVPGCLFSMVA